MTQRTITTVEDLNALPVGTAVFSYTVFLKVQSAHGLPVWGCVGSRDIYGPSDILHDDCASSATVIWEPEQ